MPRILKTWGSVLCGAVLLRFCFDLNAVDILLLAFLIPWTVDTALGVISLFRSFFSGGKSGLHTIFFSPGTVAGIAVLLVLKIAWTVYFIPNKSIDILALQDTEIVERKNYVLQRTLAADFGPETSPSFLPPAFKEEWAIGTLSMTAAALGGLPHKQPELRASHLQAIEQIIRRMLQPDIRAYEQRYWGEDALETLDGENGHIGYLGHLNYVLGIFRGLGGGDRFDDLHADISNALSRRILAKPSRYLETFPQQIFIPDNSVVVASLALFNRAHRTQQYDPAIAAWMTYTKENLLDPETNILVPWVDGAGQPVGRPRGSYAAWNVFYLVLADPEFAMQQAQLLREHFIIRLPCGACAVREYLPGIPGAADIDSGPVIFGLSTSGTGFGIASARLLKDASMMRCLLITAETVGTTIQSNAGRRYLFAPLIGDAIVLAMRTGPG